MFLRGNAVKPNSLFDIFGIGAQERLKQFLNGPDAALKEIFGETDRDTRMIWQQATTTVTPAPQGGKRTRLRVVQVKSQDELLQLIADSSELYVCIDDSERMLMKSLSIEEAAQLALNGKLNMIYRKAESASPESSSPGE